MRNLKYILYGPLQKADMLGLHIHLYTNVFAGSMEKTAELLNFKTTSTVLLLVPGLAGRRGSAMTVGPQGCLLGGCCESIADRRRWFIKLWGSLELNFTIMAGCSVSAVFPGPVVIN